MQLFRFGSKVAQVVSKYGSRGARIGRGVRSTGASQVSALYLEPGGVLGRHPASTAQLLMVVAGTGWVSGESGEQVHIQPGEAAFWTAGEHHETGSDTGLSAIIVEADDLNPAQFMPPRS